MSQFMSHITNLSLDSSQSTDFKSESSFKGSEGKSDTKNSTDNFSAMVDRHLSSDKSGNEKLSSKNNGNKASNIDVSTATKSSHSTSSSDKTAEKFDETAKLSANTDAEASGDKSAVQTPNENVEQYAGENDTSNNSLDSDESLSTKTAGDALDEQKQSQHFFSLLASSQQALAGKNNDQTASADIELETQAETEVKLNKRAENKSAALTFEQIIAGASKAQEKAQEKANNGGAVVVDETTMNQSTHEALAKNITDTITQEQKTQQQKTQEQKTQQQQAQDHKMQASQEKTAALNAQLDGKNGQTLATSDNALSQTDKNAQLTADASQLTQEQLTKEQQAKLLSETAAKTEQSTDAFKTNQAIQSAKPTQTTSSSLITDNLQDGELELSEAELKQLVENNGVDASNKTQEQQNTPLPSSQGKQTVNSVKTEALATAINEANKGAPSQAQHDVVDDDAVLSQANSQTISQTINQTISAASANNEQASTQKASQNSITTEQNKLANNEQTLAENSSQASEKQLAEEQQTAEAMINTAAELSANHDGNTKSASIERTATSPTQQSSTTVQSQQTATSATESSAVVLEELSKDIVTDNTIQTKNNAATLSETISIFRKDFAEAVKEKVMVLISQKLQQFDIQLDPPELGNVHVRVNLQNEQAVVNFTVQNQQAKEAFEENMGKLKEMLAEKGVDVGDANVEQQSQQNDNFDGENSAKGFANNGQNQSAEDNGEHLMSANLYKSSTSSVDYYA